MFTETAYFTSNVKYGHSVEYDMSDDDLKYWTPGDMKAYIVRGLAERLKAGPRNREEIAKALTEHGQKLMAEWNEHRPYDTEIVDIKTATDGTETVTFRVPRWWVIRSRAVVG